MSRIEFAPAVGRDFSRIIAFLEKHDSPAAMSRVQDIRHAIAALEHNPRIGRPVDETVRELVIGRDARGYVALYTYAAEIDTVFVLAVRAQREAGYPSQD